VSFREWRCLDELDDAAADPECFVDEPWPPLRLEEEVAASEARTAFLDDVVVDPDRELLECLVEELDVAVDGADALAEVMFDVPEDAFRREDVVEAEALAERLVDDDADEDMEDEA